MSLFEVKVRTVSYVYHEVEARTADEAAAKWNQDTEVSSVIEEQRVVSIDTAVFDDDLNEYDDDFDEEDDDFYR